MKLRCHLTKAFSLLALAFIARDAALFAQAPDPAIAFMLSRVEESALSAYVGQLSGESPVLIGGEIYTISSRNTVYSGDGLVKATQFVYEHMQSLGLPVSYQEWMGCGSNPNLSSRNVVAEKTGDTIPGEIVLVMAHLDCMPASGLSYGADDNASGSAAVMTAADFLSRHNFQRTIRFLLTTGEEQGLCGSKAYSAMASARDDNIVAVYNMDMIGWDSDNYPSLRLHTRSPDRPGYEKDLAIAETFSRTVGDYDLNLVPIIASDYSSSSPRNADQVPFWDYGYPGILAIEDNVNDFNRYNYHTLNDRLSTLNLPYLANYARATVGTIASLAHIADSSIELALPGGGAAIARTTGSPGPARSGYAEAGVVSGANPYGAAVFIFRRDGIVVSEAAVPASPPTISSRVFIDYRTDVPALPGHSEAGSVNINTGIAVVNPGTAAANVTYTLRDPDGYPVATGHGAVAAGGHFACFIDQLKETAAPDFEFPDFFADSTQFGSLEIAGDQPLSVLALRGTNNQRNDFLITSTPVADLTPAPGSDPIYFPQFVNGGGYTTSLMLMNTSGSIETGEFQIMDRNGDPMVVSEAGGAAGASFRYAILPGGIYRFQTDGFPSGTQAGWVRLIPDAGTATPAGSGVFGYNPEAVLVSESGVPAALPATHARILLDLSGNHNVGLAIANLAGAGADIEIRAFQLDGSTAAGDGSRRIPLPVNGYAAGFADQFLTGLPDGFTGVLDIRAATPFAALTLRSLLNERHDFLMTSFPVADADRAAPAPIVFPQIADGSEYVTQFILLSPESESTILLNFYSDAGDPWAAGQ